MEERSVPEPRPIIRFVNVSKAFRLPNGARLQALEDVSFDIHPGEIVALVGESGSGKSTLARLLLGLMRADEGQIFLDDQAVEALSPRDRPARPSVQPVFQDSSAAFNPRRPAYDALAQADRLSLAPAGSRAERLGSVLDQVGLHPGASYFRRYPHELSGGQRQRLAIARALAANPDIIVADEPLSGADVSIRGQVLNLLLDLRARHSISILFITHDITIARLFADRAIVLFKGKIVESGPAQDVLGEPTHAYTKTLVASVPKASF